MDFFYKPPLQRDDECKALDTNYVNCLMQKALNDKVANNICNLDSVLWFHLECPKWVQKYDHPIEFKRKFKEFFDYQYFQKQAVKHKGSVQYSDEGIHAPAGYIPHPEDVRKHEAFDEFFKKNAGTLNIDTPLSKFETTPAPEIPEEHQIIKKVDFTKLKSDEFGEPTSHQYWNKLIGAYRETVRDNLEKRRHFVGVARGEIQEDAPAAEESTDEE